VIAVFARWQFIADLWLLQIRSWSQGRHCRRSDGPRNCSNNVVERRIVFNVDHMMAIGQTRSRLICRRRQSPATGAGA